MNQIDLNKAKGRNIVEISVSDKRFRIVRVVTGVRQMYAEYIQKSAEYLSIVSQLNWEEGEDEEAHLSRVEEVSCRVESFTQERDDAYFSMLGLVLTRNGYDLDRKWWLENTDEFDRQKFLEICLTKDSGAVKKKMTGNGSTTRN